MRRAFSSKLKSEFHAHYHSWVLSFSSVSCPLIPLKCKQWLSGQPQPHRQLQQFLGFANFYRRFIQDFSKVAAPLTKLTSTLHSFAWTEEAEAAFTRLKVLFTSAPVLSHPDPSRQFVVEVDALDTGVGAVLSQQSAADENPLPCTCSHRLTPAERNYDVGNRELLPLVLALQEWRH